jgi:drug/metabolite transporter (DMT)-like permease
MLGIILALVTAVLFGISVSIQKHSMGSMKVFTVSGMLTHKVWLVALIVGLAGILTYMASMSLSPLTTVQPILAFSMVIPIIAGAAVFREKMEVWRWLFVTILVVGIFLVSLY